MFKGKDYFNFGLDYCWLIFFLWLFFKYLIGQGIFYIKLYEMVICDVYKIILNCLLMIGYLFEIIIVVLILN